VTPPSRSRWGILRKDDAAVVGGEDAGDGPTRYGHPMTRRPTPIRWLKEHPFAADRLLAGVLLVCVILSIVTADTTISGVTYREPNALAVILGVLCAVPLAWRRHNPLAALLVIGVAAVVYEAVGFPESAGTLGVLIALYSVAAHCDRRRSLTGAAFTAVGVVIVFATARWGVDLGTIVSNVVIFGTAWILGDNLRNRRAYLAGLEDRAERLEREHVEQAHRAVADERARIARELHDVVAHNVSVMVVQAGAARRTIERDPERAREALTSVEATGRQALDEMRRLLGVLRTEDEATELRAPQPSVSHLDALVAHVREAGLPVELVVEGEPRPLMSGVDMSVYRIVQEALTNSLKHAGPAHAQVVLRYGDHDLRLEVVDDGRGLAADAPVSNGGGHGLVGMRERVAIFGGEIHAGPRTGGGYVVSARLPLEPVRT
jgi:signal transduction histidine kinase